MRKLIFVLSALICLSGYAWSYPADDAYDLTGRDYFPELKKLISEAKKSIYITMYIATYYPDYTDSLPNQIIHELANAKKRGVFVRIILDQGRAVSGKDQYNDLAYFKLKDSGINADYDIPSQKLHDKLIIIDEYIIIIGSHNWSKYAFKENREASIVVKSRELAKKYIEWINSTPISPRRTPPPVSESENVYVSYKFLADPDVGSAIVRYNSKRVFDLYLYLLNKWRGRPIEINYNEIADLFGVTKWKEHAVHGFINSKLGILARRFNLIKKKYTARDKTMRVTLLDYTDGRKPLTLDPSNYFVVPGSFYEFGWLKRLSVSGKYFYFINLIETQSSVDPQGFWSHSQKHLQKKYHIGQKTLSSGVM